MDNQLNIWEVFTQSKPGQPYRHAGSVHASDRQMWVVRAEDIAATTIEDNPSFFDPNDDKIYRLPSFYTMPEGAKNI